MRRIKFDGIKQLERAARLGEVSSKDHTYTVTRKAKDTYEVSDLADQSKWPGSKPTVYLYKFIPEGDQTFSIEILKNGGWGILPLQLAVGLGDYPKGGRYFVEE